ncbi:hypothetical protein GMPD_03550 [Geomonas paludis]|uniref:Uncharacterized protein n=1 Tax=Geomonas paludis TaxID=2740185 RepID=A0A6V8MQT6_9BACT|nr:hypothetical protein GMPD_03550 [Geomonas paludis]
MSAAAKQKSGIRNRASGVNARPATAWVDVGIESAAHTPAAADAVTPMAVRLADKSTGPHSSTNSAAPAVIKIGMIVYKSCRVIQAPKQKSSPQRTQRSTEGSEDNSFVDQTCLVRAFQ